MIIFNPREIAGALDDEYEDIIRETALRFLRAVVLATPVGNPSLWSPQSLPPPPGYVGGRARGDWQVSTGGPETRQRDRIDKSGGATISEGAAKINNYNGRRGNFQPIFVQNNVPYIGVLNDGHSTQVAAGFVERAIQVATAGRGTTRELP